MHHPGPLTKLVISLAFCLSVVSCSQPRAEPAPPTSQPAAATSAPVALAPAETSTAVPPTGVPATATPLPEPTLEPTAPPTEAPTPVPPTATPAPTETPACAGPLTPTASNSEGPYYTPGAPMRASLLEEGMPGTQLVITGRVLTADCAPVAGAVLDFWQAGANGEYDNVGYTLRGKQEAAADGSYRLETVLPGEYPGRTPHIHVKVNAPGGPVLTTQIYFAGMSGNQTDSLIQPSLIIDPTPEADGSLSAVFDFVLAQ